MKQSSSVTGALQHTASSRKYLKYRISEHASQVCRCYGRRPGGPVRRRRAHGAKAQARALPRRPEPEAGGKLEVGGHL